MEGVALLQAVSGATYMLTISVVAIRLLALAGRTRQLPELMLGLTLLIGGTFGATLEGGGMASQKELSPETVGLLLLSGKLCGLVAVLCQSIFVWRVFRPDARWAPVLIGCYWSISLIAFLGFWHHGTFTSGRLPMVWFWPELFARMAASAWLVCEGARYYALMRKRRAIGIGDPLVTNRFLLWTVAGVCGMSIMLTSVPPVLNPGSTHVLMVIDLLAFSVSGIGVSVAYSLVFFPPAGYRRWIASRPLTNEA